MRKWILLCLLAALFAAAGCGSKGKQVVRPGTAPAVKPGERPQVGTKLGPGTAEIKAQAKEIAESKQTSSDLDKARLPWSKQDTSKYQAAFEKALADYLPATLSDSDRDALQKSFGQWVRYNLNADSTKVENAIGALRFGVASFASYPQPDAATQEEIDRQIDQMVGALGRSLKAVFPNSPWNVVSEELDTIAKVLKRDSRNLIFPALKYAKPEKDFSGFLKNIEKATKQSAVSYKKGTLTVDPALASAWSTTVGYVNFCSFSPPKGMMVSFLGGPRLGNVKVEVFKSPFPTSVPAGTPSAAPGRPMGAPTGR